MFFSNKKLIWVFPVIFGIILFSFILPVQAQDISKLMAEKYSISVDEQTFVIYYGFKGSLEVDVSDLEVDKPVITEMTLNKEEKSLEMTFSESEYAGPAWVRLPNELITAEGGNFQVFINKVEKPFELTYYADEISVGFFMPMGTEEVEIIGTRVIPEFSTIILVLGITMASLILATRIIQRNNLKLNLGF